MDKSIIIKKAEKVLGHRLWCRGAFEEIDVFDDGKVYCCCPAYTNAYSFGNIFENNFEEIWNGEKAKAFRESIVDGSFRFCNLDRCLPMNSLVGEWRFDVNEEWQKENIGRKGPTYVQLNMEMSCNVKCITCRDAYIKKDDAATIEKKKEVFEKVIIPMCKDAGNVFLDGVGELFVSELSQYMLKRLIETYPQIKFTILTNGILFDENLYNKFKLQKRLQEVSFSVHAFTKETYDKIVRGGNFEKVKKNIEFFAGLKKSGENFAFYLNFVVHSLNYREMIDFQKWANELNVRTHFSEYRKWGADIDKEYEKYAVFESFHPDHEEFLKIVKNDIFNSKNCFINTKLRPIET